MMTKRLLMSALFLLAFAVNASAQLKCDPTVPPNQFLAASGANHFYAVLQNQNTVLADGTPVVVSYSFGAWAATVTNANTVAPLQGPTTIPKTAFVPVPGEPDCYELTGGLPGLIPTTTGKVVSLRANGQPNATPPQSAWAVPSNSFTLAPAAQTPAVPGLTRIIKPPSP